ncbi:hypothetical protein [Polaromonas sp.]|uniref:hypothetical protein n=1 Tax=Polaromonas sp. TaxID=1869339 RepID=UPI003529D5FF
MFTKVLVEEKWGDGLEDELFQTAGVNFSPARAVKVRLCNRWTGAALNAWAKMLSGGHTREEGSV